MKPHTYPLSNLEVIKFDIMNDHGNTYIVKATSTWSILGMFINGYGCFLCIVMFIGLHLKNWGKG